METRALECGLNPSHSELISWQENYEALSKFFYRYNIPKDVVIAFEYMVPVGGRIDCVLFGHGKDDKSNMIHMELKQWSNENVSEHYNGYTFCTNIIVL